MFGKIGVGFAKGFGTEEAIGRGEGRGVRGFDDEMLGAVDVRTFGFGVIAPEDEDEVLALEGELANDGVGEFLPSSPLMRAGRVSAHGECRVEKENALLGPAFQVACAAL